MSGFSPHGEPTWQESLTRASDEHWQHLDVRRRWQRVACAAGAAVLAVAAVVARLHGGL